MVLGILLLKDLHKASDVLGLEFSHDLGKLKNLVACVFYGTCLMAAYMACLGGNDAFITLKHGCNDGLVCLCSSANELNLSIRSIACCLYLFLS